MLDALPLPDDWRIAAIVAIAACLQGTGGLGFNMFAAPLVAIWRPDLVPGPMIVLALAMGLMGWARERHAVDRAGLAWAMAGRAGPRLACPIA